MDSFDKFKKDLRYGEDSEILFCIYLIKNDLIINNLNLDYKYDIKAFSKKLDRHLFFELKMGFKNSKYQSQYECHTN